MATCGQTSEGCNPFPTEYQFWWCWDWLRRMLAVFNRRNSRSFLKSVLKMIHRKPGKEWRYWSGESLGRSVPGGQAIRSSSWWSLEKRRGQDIVWLSPDLLRFHARPAHKCSEYQEMHFCETAFQRAVSPAAAIYLKHLPFHPDVKCTCQ